MPDIRHSITVNAPVEEVRRLVGSWKGLTRWWAADVTEDKTTGAVEIGFFNRSTVYRLMASKAASPLDVVWVCETGKEWAGTRLLFHLESKGSQTQVRFTHADWEKDTDYFVDCTTTWGHLMYKLKAAAEDGRSDPLFTRTGLAP